MIVKSIVPLSDSELRVVERILRDSADPQKDLSKKFPDAYHHMDVDTIYFGAHSYDYSYEVYPKKA